MEKRITNWKLRCSRADKEQSDLIGKEWNATVPGDITDILIRNGVVGDINYADNCLKYRWVNRTEWIYSADIRITAEEYSQDLLFLRFEGIDTFADILINGRLILQTKNMFQCYSIDLKDKVHVGVNTLDVVIKPIDENMRSFGDKYIGAFMNERLSVRKAQCHFGWDWAPNFYGMGIWQPVSVIAKSRRTLEYVRIRTRASGTVTFFPEVNYSIRKEEFSQWQGDYFCINIYDGKKIVVSENFPVDGYKTLCNLTIPSPKLWYPNGYGVPHLYRYEIELKDDHGEIIDSYSNSFGIREIKILQEPMGKSRLGFEVEVNGKRIFLKGSNWVPAGFMTGAIDDYRYKKLLKLAQEAGFNTLRVWGGGIYEQDIFYRLCDEYGILLWHDFMFACGDIPDDQDDFCQLVKEEAIYQVRRLANHPCMLLLNGGNETKQSFAYSDHPERGKYLTDYILQGVCAGYSDVPFFSSCPWSYTDWGNDLNSGDCHKCAIFESAVKGHMERYREYIVKNKPVTTECAMLGPCRMRNLRKFIPEEKLWPINEIWDLHFVDNPYEPKLPPSFARLEKMIAESLFGQVEGVEDFVKKAMIAHADILTAEIEYARADAAICSGIMNWMYNDIWRNGTWSVVDYDLACKPAYYAMKRAFSKISAGILLRDRYCVFASNDSLQTVSGVLKFGQRRLNGELLFVYTANIVVDEHSAVEIEIPQELCKETDSYIFVQFSDIKNIYFVNGYIGTKFQTALQTEVSAVVKKSGRYYADVRICAQSFAKSVFIDAAEKFDLWVQDNYFDLESGDERSVRISSVLPFSAEDIVIKTFADVWEE